MIPRFRSIEHHIGIFDTSGAEDYERLRPLSYPQTDVFIICARIPRPSMFTNVGSKWIPEIQKHCPDSPFLIVGMIDEDDHTSLAASLEQQSQRNRNAPKTVAGYNALGRQLVERHEKAWKYMQCDLASDEDVKRVFQQVSFPWRWVRFALTSKHPQVLLAHMNQHLDVQKEKPRRIHTFGRRRQMYDPIDLEDIDEDDWSHASSDKHT